MALRLAATGQIGADPNDEEEQQYERSYGAPPGGGGRYQGGSHRQLRQRQQDPQRGRQGCWYAKVNQRLLRSDAIGKLRHSSHAEDQDEQQTGYKQRYMHETSSFRSFGRTSSGWSTTSYTLYTEP
jgi:hypothetical protein